MKALYVKAIFVILVLFASTAYSQSDCKCKKYDDLVAAGKSKVEIYAEVIK